MPTAPDLSTLADADDMAICDSDATTRIIWQLSKCGSPSAIAACSAATRQLVALSRRKEQEAKAAKDNVDRYIPEFYDQGRRCDDA